MESIARVYRKKTQVLIFGIVVIMGLSGCSNEVEKAKNDAVIKNMTNDALARQAALDTYKFSYADGVDICFKKVKEKLGETAMVNSIGSIFKVKKTDGGQKSNPFLYVCTVKYQDPKNPKQLLSLSMDTNTGEFKEPRPLELNIIGGDAEKFKLESILIPLKDVNTSTVQAKIDQNMSKLDARYTDYSVYFLDLADRGVLNTEQSHTLSLNIAGKFKTNGTKASIGIKLSTDGQQVISNDLDK
jgi:hypothetical protein